MEKKKKAIVPWFTFPSNDPSLIGSRCKGCGDYFFPKVTGCRNPNCRSKDVEEVLLSKKGTLWSYIVQQAAPPPPFPEPARNPFVPYALAEVKLPEGLRVLGQVSSDVDPKSLKIGMEMELAVEKFYEDQEGVEVMIWKFKPAEKGKRNKK